MAAPESDALSALRAANDRFYRALETLDLPGMDGLWLHGPQVRCIHPGWDVIVGWDDVRSAWERILQNTGWIRVSVTQSHAEIMGDVGLVGCSENITSGREGDVSVAVAQATNLFRLTPGGWRMFLHHASLAPVHVTQAFSGVLQ
ncbi:MAG: nuclear transport factor 2 family protein [Vicinamibacteria bacterium]